MSLEREMLGANSVRPNKSEQRRVQEVEDGEAAERAKEVEWEVDEEVREPKRVHNPALPSRAEVEAHMLTHAPFRS